LIGGYYHFWPSLSPKIETRRDHKGDIFKNS
jgi:hypothetical protein